MRASLIFASWCMILFGVIHEATFIYTYIATPEGEPVVQAMKSYPVTGTPSHLYSFYTGYALMMGLLLVAFGAINLILVKAGAERLFASTALGTTNFLVCLGAFLLSAFYFSFAVPVGLTGIALVLVTLALFQGRRLRYVESTGGERAG